MNTRSSSFFGTKTWVTATIPLFILFVHFRFLQVNAMFTGKHLLVFTKGSFTSPLHNTNIDLLINTSLPILKIQFPNTSKLPFSRPRCVTRALIGYQYSWKY